MKDNLTLSIYKRVNQAKHFQMIPINMSANIHYLSIAIGKLFIHNIYLIIKKRLYTLILLFVYFVDNTCI